MEEKNLLELVKETHEALTTLNKKKRKKHMRVMRKAKVSRRKKKKGYIGIIKIEENGNMSGEKVKVEDFVYKLKKGNYHVTDGGEKIWWNGKYPVLFQPTWKLFPLDLRKDKQERNETKGQKLVLATMKKDLIKVKAKGSNILIFVLIAVVVFIGWNLIKGGA